MPSGTIYGRGRPVRRRKKKKRKTTVVRPELKLFCAYKDNQEVLPVTGDVTPSGGLMYQFPTPTQGVTNYARIGDKINIVSLLKKIRLYPTVTGGSWRIICFQWLDEDMSAPTVADILQPSFRIDGGTSQATQMTPGTAFSGTRSWETAAYRHNNRQRFKIMSDIRMSTNPGNQVAGSNIYETQHTDDAQGLPTPLPPPAVNLPSAELLPRGPNAFNIPLLQKLHKKFKLNRIKYTTEANTRDANGAQVGKGNIYIWFGYWSNIYSSRKAGVRAIGPTGPGPSYLNTSDQHQISLDDANNHSGLIQSPGQPPNPVQTALNQMTRAHVDIASVLYYRDP